MAGKAAKGAAAGGAMLLALGLWIASEGDGPKSGPDQYRSYQDIAKVWTICHGHTGPDVGPNMTASGKICRELAEKDLTKAFEAEDLYLVRVEELAPPVRAAGAVFIGNVGVAAFKTSSFRRLLNERRIPEACNSLLLWVKAAAGPMGKLVVVTGLINRRTAERRLCLGEAW